MAVATFEVTTYSIKLAREMTLGGGGIKFWSYIDCRGGGHQVVIYFLKPTSGDLDNNYWPDRSLGTIVVPWDQYPHYVDVLRNERPVYCYLDSNRPITNRIYTGQEPVGEEED